MLISNRDNVNDATLKMIRRLIEDGYVKESPDGDIRVLPDQITIEIKDSAARLSFVPCFYVDPFVLLFDSLWALSGLASPGAVPGGSNGFGDPLEIAESAQRSKGEFILYPKIFTGDKAYWGPIVFNTDRYGLVTMTTNCTYGRVGFSSTFFKLSMLHEFVAASAGRGIGKHVHVNYQLSLLMKHEKTLMSALSWDGDPYQNFVVQPVPLMSREDPQIFIEDLHMFLSEPEAIGTLNRFFRVVAKPMYRIYIDYIENGGMEFDNLLPLLPDNSDWAYAVRRWKAMTEDEYDPDADVHTGITVATTLSE
jgi:hypothetical protein